MFANTRTEKPTAGCGSNVETSDGVITVRVPPLRGSWAPAGLPATRMHARLATSASSHREIRRSMGASCLPSVGDWVLDSTVVGRFAPRRGAPPGGRRPRGSARRPDERLLVGKAFRILVLEHELRRAPAFLVVRAPKHEHRAPAADPEAPRDLGRRRHRLHDLMRADEPDTGLALDSIGHRKHRRAAQVQALGDLPGAA